MSDDFWKAIANQDAGKFPALTRRQEYDRERIEKRLQEFLKDHNLGSDEDKWIGQHHHDAHGAMLGAFWHWCVKDQQVVTMNTLETADSKKASMAIRKFFPNFEKQSHAIKELLETSPAFETEYMHLASSQGGSQANVAFKTPMFHEDVKLHMDSTEPSARGIRMKAVLAVVDFLGISFEKM